MSEMLPLVEIRNATVYRGDTRVFDGLDLVIEGRSSVAILGPNGAGKTTLLMLLTRDLYPVVAPGSFVRLLGRETWNVSELRSTLGIVSPEMVRLPGASTGLEAALSGFHSSAGQVGLPVDASQIDRARAASLEMGVEHLLDRRLESMSVGERRRFLLARALVHDPATLILDEPTAGLDPAAALGFVETLERLQSSGRQLILVTHQVHEIPATLQDLVMIRCGGVWKRGPKADLLVASRLSELYGERLEVVHRHGRYQVLLAGPEGSPASVSAAVP